MQTNVLISQVTTKRDAQKLSKLLKLNTHNVDPFGGFHKWGYPIMDGLLWKIFMKIMENPMKMDDEGYPYFRKPPF